MAEHVRVALAPLELARRERGQVAQQLLRLGVEVERVQLREAGAAAVGEALLKRRRPLLTRRGPRGRAGARVRAVVAATVVVGASLCLGFACGFGSRRALVLVR